MTDIKERLAQFRRANEELLALGRDLLPLLNGTQARRVIAKPLMLQLIMEKQLELIEEKLLPSLPDPDACTSHHDDTGAGSLGGSSDKSLLIDDFRAYARRGAPASEKAGTAPGLAELMQTAAGLLSGRDPGKVAPVLG